MVFVDVGDVDHVQRLAVLAQTFELGGHVARVGIAHPAGDQNAVGAYDKGAVSLLVLASGPIRQATRAIAVAVSQSAPGSQLVIAHDSAVATAAIEGLPVVSDRRIEFLPVGGMTPGSIRNAAMALCTGEWIAVIDGSERLSPGHINACQSALTSDRSALFATDPGTWWPEAAVVSAQPLQLVDLLAGPWALSVSTVFRLDAIQRAGGFDEQLPAFVEWDMMLRLAAPAILLPLDVQRLSSDDIMLLESLRADRHLPSLRAIVERHRSAFEGEPVQVLTRREAIARRLWTRERSLVERRRQLQS